MYLVLAAPTVGCCAARKSELSGQQGIHLRSASGSSEASLRNKQHWLVMFGNCVTMAKDADVYEPRY